MRHNIDILKMLIESAKSKDDNEPKPRKTYLIIDGKRMECQGYCDYFGEYDCGYNTDIFCEDCVFVVGVDSGDMRIGKRPFSVKREAK